ncbi:MAG: hypothetical protein F6J90_09715 [Moorea sp. SIOASIH]|uniref:hypothetical protein n=1 Tax=Moorena sp. SIOASIH TaxID=2607817 RepID=UPI0013BE27F6|nr:hypothetical protein [Moorena sp. SIOASIH]NEO36585.1 hypothetical protein [Moorena sp. SIOASIH]
MRLTLAKRPRYANGHAIGIADAARTRPAWPTAKRDRYIKLALSLTHRTPKLNLQNFP